MDAPYHFIDKGDGIETLDLDVLIGGRGHAARGWHLCSRTAASSERLALARAMFCALHTCAAGHAHITLSV